MNELFNKTITIERASGEWIAGRYVKGEPQIITAKCSVQPFNDKNKNTIIEPGGRRRSAKIRIYIGIKLNQSDEKSQKPADVIIYDGKKWEIQDEQNWQSDELPYFRFIAEEIEGNGGGE